MSEQPTSCPTCKSEDPDEDGEWDYDGPNPEGCPDAWHDTYPGTCACGQPGIQFVHGRPWCGDDR